MLLLPLQLVMNPLVGYLSHVFPVGHLITSRNISQRILKPRVPSLPLREKLQQCVKILTGLRRHPVREPRTLVVKTEVTNVQCVTSWLAKHKDTIRYKSIRLMFQIQLRLLQSRYNPWHLHLTQLILHNQRLKWL